MKIAAFYKYSWFSDLAYVKWSDENTASVPLIINAANAAQRIPGSTTDNEINTLGEKIFQTTGAGGLGWQVLHFLENVPDSGFAASLYGDGNEKVLAFQGTNQVIDDLVNADLRDIVGLGVAVEQAISLINWVRRLAAPEGADVEHLPCPRMGCCWPLPRRPCPPWRQSSWWCCSIPSTAPP